MHYLLFLLAVTLPAQDRNKAADWPSHAVTPKASIGAEYMVRSVMHPGGNVVVRDYLIVELAVYPNAREEFVLSHQHFTLRINGRKSPIFPQTPGMVAASLKYDDWEMRPNLEASGGAGNTGVILGRPRQSERFPGDPSARNRLPKPPTAPVPEDRSGLERDRAPKTKPDEIVVSAAIEEGPVSKPRRGYLYFAQKGKAESFKKVELLYSGPAGEAVISLK
ncbi:MAG: hypothetical protein JNK48_16680 [Bryobacterales bacterium]|nr:hypothetical protein [Bryobacterales bacterium]